MAAHTTSNHPDIERMAAEAEAGPGANAQPWDQTVSSTDQVKEKAMNNGSLSSPPSESSAEPAPSQKPQWQPPGDEDEQKRSKGKTALLMLALCVCDPEIVTGAFD